MPQLKAPPAPKVNWLNEAWAISRVIADMPSDRPGGIYGHPVARRELRKLGGVNALLALQTKNALHPSPPKKPAPWPLDDQKRAHIELLQLQVMLYLTYRLDVVHNFWTRPPWWKSGQLPFESRRPADTQKFALWLTSSGFKVSPAESHAMNAHMMLGRILLDRWVSPEWKRRLPLAIASISGPSASEVAVHRATQPRTRKKNGLRDAKLQAMRRCPGASWKKLLDDLTGEDVVVAWDDKQIKWRDDDDTLKTTSVSRFQKMK
jgi:hypothetical protein